MRQKGQLLYAHVQDIKAWCVIEIGGAETAVLCHLFVTCVDILRCYALFPKVSYILFLSSSLILFHGKVSNRKENKSIRIAGIIF